MSTTECEIELKKNIDFEFYKVLFDPVRCDIIQYLSVHEEASIHDIQQNFTQDRSVISRHLDLLYRHQIVTKTKQSRHVMYRLSTDIILAKFKETTQAIENLIEHTGE